LIKRGIKSFNTFKESYLKQKRAKKEELKNLFLNADSENRNKNKNKDMNKNCP